MSSDTERRIRAECRDWLALLHSGDASDDDRARFDAWLQADHHHRRAYDQLQLIWQDIASLGQLKDLEPVPPRRAERAPPISRAPRRFAPFAAAAAVAGLAIAILWSQQQPVSQAPTTAAILSEEYSTQLGEVRAIQLSDGSTLTLGARSHAIVQLGDTERRVQLQQGEAYFEVAKDAARPFYVLAPATAVRVVGTRFDVRVGESHVRVAVDEGVVAVNDRPAALTGGQRIDVLPDGALTDVTQVDSSEVAAWREGRLIYDGVTLAEVVADLARYRANVTLKSEQAGKLRVTAGLRVEQIDQFVDRLPDILPVRVTRTPDAIVIDGS
jgi:transmembrane sensor